MQKQRLNGPCCAHDRMVPWPGDIAVSIIKDPDRKELSSYFQVRVRHRMRVKATGAEAARCIRSTVRSREATVCVPAT